MNGVVQGFMVIAVVVGLGYVVGRTGVLGDGAVEVLSRTAFFVATPALLFVILAGANVRAVFSDALVVTVVTSTLVCLLYVPLGCCATVLQARRRWARWRAATSTPATSACRSRPTPSATPPPSSR